MIPKKTGYKTKRQLKKAAYRIERPKVRERAFELDGGRCIWPTCRRVLSLEFAHMHEVHWRGRGGDPTNIDIVVTTCPLCHNHIHPRVGGALKRMEGTRTTGFTYFARATGKDEWQEVTV